MNLPTLEDDLLKLVIDLESLEKQYKDKKHQDNDKIIEGIYKGQYEAYLYASTKIKQLLRWNGVIE